MTPVDAASGSPAPRAFALRPAGAPEAAPRPFALHLDEAGGGGLPLRAAPRLAPRHDPQAALHRVAREFEAAFMRQMFEVMRRSVPQESASGAQSDAQQMFTSMLDDKLASVAAQRSRGGLGDALYHQLATHLPPSSDAADRSDR